MDFSSFDTPAAFDLSVIPDTGPSPEQSIGLVKSNITDGKVFIFNLGNRNMIEPVL